MTSKLILVIWKSLILYLRLAKIFLKKMSF